MRLDLAHHDLDPLFRHQRLFVLPHELQVQPHVVEDAAAHHRHRQIADGQRTVVHEGVHQHGGHHDHRVAQGNDRFALADPGVFLYGKIHQIYQQRRADDVAAVPQRPPHEMVVLIDPEANAGEERRHVDRQIEADQKPRRPIGSALADDIVKQYDDQRAHTVPPDAHRRSGKGVRDDRIQQIAQQVLHDQAEHGRHDQQHDRFVLFPDIRVDQHREGQADQLQQQRQQHRTAR